MPPCLSFFISFPPRTYRTPYQVPGVKEVLREEIPCQLGFSWPHQPHLLLFPPSCTGCLSASATCQHLAHHGDWPGTVITPFFTWQIHLIERVHPSISSLKNSIPSLFFFSSLCIISNNHLWLNVSSPTGAQVQEIYMSYPTFLDPKGLEPCLECNRPG